MMAANRIVGDSTKKYPGSDCKRENLAFQDHRPSIIWIMTTGNDFTYLGHQPPRRTQDFVRRRQVIEGDSIYDR